MDQARRSFSVTLPTSEQLVNFLFEVLLLYLPAVVSVMMVGGVAWAFLPDRHFYITLPMAGYFMYLAGCFMVWFAVSQVQFKTLRSKCGFLAAVMVFHLAAVHIAYILMR